jgi:hypothetical protein
MTPPMVECDECRYWARDPHRSASGECHRYAPRGFLVPDKQTADADERWAYWPLTTENEGCGEGERKEAAEEQPSEVMTLGLEAKS